jgi:thiamine-monophosphate kinase
LSEDELVAAIAALGGRGSRVIVGIGDDAAVWQPSRSHRSVITTDALVDGVHFARAWMSLEDIGWRAMAANASDLAAMGARGVLTTVALALPADLGPADVLELYRGLNACAAAYQCPIAGGDLTRSPVLAIAITAVGEVRATNLKLRSGARAGDVLAVTGPLGASRAGLAYLRGELALDGELAQRAVNAHRRPLARMREGRFLAGSRNVHAMMDCSDGLSTDLARLLTGRGLGARIDKVPVDPSARVAAELLGEDPDDFALAGGEDFELLVAVAPRAFAHLAARFAAHTRRPLVRIGTVQADGGLIVVKGGEPQPVQPTGWDHFA